MLTSKVGSWSYTQKLDKAEKAWQGQVFCGLYYKHVTIVNDDSSVINKWSFKLIDDPRIVIYDRHKFIIQATDLFCLVMNGKELEFC